MRSVYAMEQRERVQQRAKAKREAGGKQLGPRHGYTPCNSASFAGAGDVEVPLNPNLSNLAKERNPEPGRNPPRMGIHVETETLSIVAYRAAGILFLGARGAAAGLREARIY